MKYYFKQNIKIFISALYFSIITLNIFAQQKQYTVEEYIEKFKYVAINDMKTYGIPASIKLAQGIIESGFGNAYLAQQGNNHFGIKCNNGWTGDTILKDDDEKNDCFRKYKDAAESYHDHSEFLKNGKRYAFLFELDITDYKSWAFGLKSAGYATAPDYAQKLIRVIEQNRLYVFDSQFFTNDENENSEIAGQVTSNTNYSTDEIEVVIFTGDSRKVFTRNGRNFVIAKKGDTPLSLGKEFELAPLFIRKFNDIKKNQNIVPGQIIFIEPKKSKAEKDYHIVKQGESMYAISQNYGIKLKKLYKRNNMTAGQEANPGQKLWLNKKKTE